MDTEVVTPSVSTDTPPGSKPPVCRREFLFFPSTLLKPFLRHVISFAQARALVQRLMNNIDLVIAQMPECSNKVVH